MTDLTINDALARRRTVRDFSDEQIPLDALKRLAWAAQGITSSDGKRTAPSAHALHPLELFCLPNRIEGLSQTTARRWHLRFAFRTEGCSQSDRGSIYITSPALVSQPGLDSVFWKSSQNPN